MGTAWLSVLWIILLSIRGSDGQFMCYACIYTNNPSGEGYKCVSAPQNITDTDNKVECDLQEVCHVEETTSISTGEILTLVRGCGDRQEGCQEDGYERECTTICSDHSLCNDHNHAPATTTRPPPTSTTTKDPNAQLNCYYCQFDSDLNVDEGRGPSECVTAPENITGEANTVRCPAQGKSCYIWQTRNRETKHVRSMVRACRETENVEDVCSPLQGTRDEICVLQCEEDLCNNEKGTTGTATGGPASIQPVVVMASIVVGLIITGVTK